MRVSADTAPDAAALTPPGSSRSAGTTRGARPAEIRLSTRAAGDGLRYPPGFLCIRMNSMSFLITALGS